MKISHYIIAALTLAALAAPVAKAQNTTLSPYSRFGYGLLNDYASGSQRSMGSVGIAMNNSRQINVMNPASYCAIDTLTFLFDIGVDLKQLNSVETLSDGTSAKGHRFTGGLDYITMQFPLGRFMGGSVGLLPYSQVGYSFGSEIVNGQDSHQGSGSINELYLGVAAKPFKGFSIGFNISYLFGNLVNDTYLMSDGTSGGATSTSLFERVTQVRDYNLRFGAQYSWNIGAKNRFTLGAVFTPAKSFHGHAYAIKYDVSSDSKPDTISPGVISLKGHNSAPATYGAGLSYHFDNRLYVEADFTYQPWKSAKFFEFPDFDATSFNDRWKAALGVQYTPSTRGGYLKRVNYRAGAFIDTDYIMVRGNKVKDIGVSVGFGLPAPVNRWTKTVVNVGFEYRHRTTSPIALVKENYFNVTIGINFNELWFWQNKIQ
ncbi:MAG: hypothetical protein K2H61_08385 [Muribaculaceae bacterium]|nr:hypothetical protein [Muribaculaceae bacterium]MDE7393620.1 hypothetical protein [Muribaculaceae bacterium]